MADIHLLNRPTAYFSNDFSNYARVIDYSVAGVSPIFWEYESICCYVNSGNGFVNVNGIDHEICEGSLFWLQTFHVFYFRSDSEKPLVLDLILYPYAQMVLMNFSNTEARQEQFILTNLICVHLTGKFKREAEYLISDYREETEKNDLYSSAVRQCLIRRLNYLPVKTTVDVYAVGMESPPIENDIFTYIFNMSTKDLGIDEICSHFSMTAVQVNKHLHKICNSNFSQVLSHARISNTCSLMLRDISFIDIAQYSGFSSEGSFYRSFKAARGCTPDVYRKFLDALLKNRRQTADVRFAEISSYILSNYREQITIKTCSHALYIPEEEIEPILKSKYGSTTTFTSYLNKCRIRFAASLLMISSKSCMDIAMDAGYNSQHTFIRHFKKEFGVTPNEFRKNIGKPVI